MALKGHMLWAHGIVFELQAFVCKVRKQLQPTVNCKNL